MTISGEKQSVIKELKEKNASTYKAADDEPSPHDISSKDPEMEALMKERRAVSESRFKLLEKQQVWSRNYCHFSVISRDSRNVVPKWP